MDIDSLVRNNIRFLKPYSSARHEFDGVADVYLDANESPYPTRTNRYPDPLQKDLKKCIGEIKGVSPQNIFLGNGSDEAIDLLIRIFCEPGESSILILPPTYGMYQVSANISDIAIQTVPLQKHFQPDVKKIISTINESTKIIFICSPNNPTGTVVEISTIEEILNDFEGIVVVDEAYIDFSNYPSIVNRINDFGNLVVLQTFSKAWGLAGIRLGLTFASSKIIDYLNSVKPPYNINVLTQDYALRELRNYEEVKNRIQNIKGERARLAEGLRSISAVKKIFPSEANFLLVQFERASEIFELLKKEGIVVRDRSNVLMCEGCLRITIGLPHENDRLLNTLKEIA